MPQVIFRFDPLLFTDDRYAIETLGKQIIPLMATAITTEKYPLTEADIDWVPQAYEPGYSAGIIAIEVRTIGFPERKAKLNKITVKGLKARILGLPLIHNLDINKDAPLIWVQFQDPDGVHV